MTDDDAPFETYWSGEAFVPLLRHAPRLRRAMKVGERYWLARHEPQSSASVRHWHACIGEAWKNLPEDIASDFPTTEHLRKWALIKAGWEDHHCIPCSCPGEARRVASMVRPLDRFAVVQMSGDVVTVYRARSQKRLGKKAFQEVKEKGLGVLADLLGITVEQLSSNAGRAA